MTTPIPIFVVESPRFQSSREGIVYSVTTTPWGSTPTTLSVKGWDITDPTPVDVTSTVFPSGSPAAVGDVVTLPKFKSLTRGRTYRWELYFTAGGSDWCALCDVVCPW